MSITTAAPSYTSMNIETCAAHPGKHCVEFKLPDQPEGDQLAFIIVSMRHANEPTQIGVVDDLFKDCKPYRMPSGYDVVSNRTVHFFYPDHTHADVMNESRGKLADKLEQRLAEIIDDRNAKHRRDPQTHLVSAR